MIHVEVDEIDAYSKFQQEVQIIQKARVHADVFLSDVCLAVVFLDMKACANKQIR